MKPRFEEAAEQDLRDAFIAARGGTSGYANHARSCIRCSCLAFREAFPGDSILNHTHSTDWVRPWNARQARCSFGMRLNRLVALGGWWQWLFKRHVIDDNVFKFVSCVQLAQDMGPRLTLRCNLQRYITEYLESRSDLSSRSRGGDSSWLMRFNVFINQWPGILGGGTTNLVLGEDVLGAWFRSVCAGRPRATVVCSAGALSTFLNYLVSKGVLAENALNRLREAFPVGKRVGVVRPGRGRPGHGAPRARPATAVSQPARQPHCRLFRSQARRRVYRAVRPIDSSRLRSLCGHARRARPRHNRAARTLGGVTPGPRPRKSSQAVDSDPSILPLPSTIPP